MKPKFFRAPEAFRAWLDEHHAGAAELLVGFHKKDSGRPSMTWPESVDCALCYGWIDGIRKRVDDDSYTIRFTPRRPRSIWSAVNIGRVGELEKLGLMRPAGDKAFAARTENRSGIYAYEQRTDTLPEIYAKQMRKNKAAWTFFKAQPPSYRKRLGWWVVSAKQEATRLKRLTRLIEESAEGGAASVMARYVAFLRAINVGGHTVTMARLRELFEGLGFGGVETFIASGNVWFTSPSKATSTLERRIESRLEESLGYEVKTFVRTEPEVVAVAGYKPFPAGQIRNAGAFCVGFLAVPLDAAARRALEGLTTSIDRFHTHGREVYWLCEKRQHESKFSNVVFEKTTKARVTFRGANTIVKLAARAGGGA